MRDRVIKIEEHEPARRFGEAKASKLRLKGHWLREAGFVAGDVVRVVRVAPGVLEVRRVVAPPPTTEGYAEAIGALEQALACHDR